MHHIIYYISYYKSKQVFYLNDLDKIICNEINIFDKFNQTAPLTIIYIFYEKIFFA